MGHNIVKINNKIQGVQLGKLVIDPKTRLGSFVDGQDRVVFVRPATEEEVKIAIDVAERAGLR